MEARTKILTFCETYRLQDAVINALVRQKGVEFFDVHLTSDNPHYAGEDAWAYKNMLLNWQKMEMLAKAYDKVWMVEDDTIPPDDALQKLLEVDGPVVAGLFAHRHLPYEPSVQKAKRTPYTWEEIRPFMGQTIEVQGTATGCILFDRSFLDRYKVDMSGYYDPRLGYDKLAQDELLSEFCRREKIPMLCRTDVHCGHVKANGDIIYPKDFLHIHQGEV